MPKFEFQAEGHKYLIDGHEWPSVTLVLPKSPYMKNSEDARVKGNYVHDMVRLYLLNDLVEPVDPVLQPYLDALKLFLRDSRGMGITGAIDIKSGANVVAVSAAISELRAQGIEINCDCVKRGKQSVYYYSLGKARKEQ